MPAAGHLVHMPAHIYERTGDYGSAARSNVEAAKADEAYIKASGLQGVYPMMYYSHNLHFLAIANSMAGRYADAIDAAQKLEAHVRPSVKNMPMAEGFVPTPMLIMVRFHKWDEILTLPQPDASLVLTNTVWHFARGMAYATIGNVEKAAIERDALFNAVKSIPPEAAFGLNPAGKILSIAENVVSARIATAKRDNKTALELLRKAVEIEDSLAYDEPPAWPMPVRESLGGALMTSGDYLAAEQVFREDLQRNQRNGRSLFGLMESLKAQKKDYPAMMVQREFENAWKNADTKLTVPDLWR
jgi:tetratricopeptide (TPR) repeat protein